MRQGANRPAKPGPFNPQTLESSTVNQGDLIKAGIALAIVYGIYRFVPGNAVKAAALGVGGTIIAKQLPFVKDALA